MTGKAEYRLFADFQNADPKGRVRLNTRGTQDDLRALGVSLRTGLHVRLHDGEEFEADATVCHCKEEGWVAVINWDELMPWNPDDVNG
jgi:hypothetical protein